MTRREIGLLFLPVGLLCALALWQGAVPRIEDLNPSPFRIEINAIEQSTVAHSTSTPKPDTKVRLKLSTAGAALFTNRNDWGWFEDIHLVAVKNGKTRTISDSWNTISTINFVPIFISGHGKSGSSGNQNYHVCEWDLKLRDIPASWGTLELRGKFAFGPHDNGIRPMPKVRTAKSIIAYIERSGKGLVIPVRISLKKFVAPNLTKQNH
jgi:hypothetical protein